MSQDKECRLCASHDLELVLDLPHAPRSISKLLLEDELATDEAGTIDVYQCRNCSFVQHFDFVPETFYDDYIMTVTHSPQMRRYQEAQAAHFVDYFDLAGKCAVELGCGDGNFMRQLAVRGLKVSGIEPSATFRRESERLGYRVYPGYIAEEMPAPDGPYDVFVTRQVLEHVPDPIDFLKGARASITQAGVGLIEVPSLEQALRDGRFFDFFRDHVNYFTFDTLLAALTKAGFETVFMDRGMNGEYLVAYVRVSELSSVRDLRTARQTLSTQIRDFVDSFNRAGQRVAVWGAGGKGLACMAAAGAQGVIYFVDSDTHKQGRFAPATHLPIYSPSRLQEDPVDAVILTSLAYADEIIEELRKNLGFRGTVAVIGKSLMILEA